MFDELSPKELQELCKELKSSAEEARPEDVNQKEPDSLKAYMGDYYTADDKDGKQGIHSSVNLVLGAFGDFLPKLLGKTPVPNCKARADGREEYAMCMNSLIAYRDSVFAMRNQYRDFLQNCFLRGTGVLRTVWDNKKGISRTSSFSPRDLWIDDSATRLADAQHIIERQRCRRWEAAARFGKSAWKIPPDQEVMPGRKEADGQPTVPSKLKEEGKSAMDVVAYYALWSRHGDDKRIYYFHEEWNEDYLYVDDDGKPGEPWPFAFADGEWHINIMPWEFCPDRPWGISFFESARGPIKSLQRFLSYALQARDKNSKQFILCRESLAPIAQKVAENRFHFGIVPIPDDICNGVQDLTALFQVCTSSDLAPSVDAGIGMAQGLIGVVTGLKAVSAPESSNIETAQEAMQLSAANDLRVSDQQAKVEEAITAAHKTEAAMDAWFMPTNPVVCWYMQDEKKDKGDEDSYAGDQDDDAELAALVGGSSGGVANPKRQQRAIEKKTAGGRGGVIYDATYEEALLLEKGPPSVEGAAEEMAEAQSAQMMGGQPPQMTPEVQVRAQRQIPPDAEVVIIQPGAQAFVGSTLAAAWMQGATQKQIDRELTINVKSGSSSRMGQMAKQNSLLQLFKLGVPAIFQANQMWKEYAAFINAMFTTTEIDDILECRVTAEGLAKAAQAAQQMAQQQAQQQFQQAQQADKDKLMLKAQLGEHQDMSKELSRAKADNQESSGVNQGKGLDLQKTQVQRDIAQIRADSRERDRAANMTQTMMGGR